MSPFFVYGTLKRGELRESQWPHLPEKVVSAYVLGTLYDLGSYPAFVATGEDKISGELWFIDQQYFAETQAVLDEIEGYPALYQRTMIDAVTENGQTFSAWIYTYAKLSNLRSEMIIQPNANARVSWSKPELRH